MNLKKLIIDSVIIGVIGITLSACSSNQSWQNKPLINFDHLQLPSKPHYCLACQNCSGKRQINTPTYSLSAQNLQSIWQQVVLSKPRAQIVLAQGYKQRYIQRSALWHFPDIIDVNFVPIDSGHTQIKIFSRSVYGYYDFGVNCRRVKRWLNELEQHINKKQTVS